MQQISKIIVFFVEHDTLYNQREILNPTAWFKFTPLHIRQ